MDLCTLSLTAHVMHGMIKVEPCYATMKVKSIFFGWYFHISPHHSLRYFALFCEEAPGSYDRISIHEKTCPVSFSSPMKDTCVSFLVVCDAGLFYAVIIKMRSSYLDDVFTHCVAVRFSACIVTLTPSLLPPAPPPPGCVNGTKAI